jgi:hydrogenase nickel incorporation protein HypA/HybF
MHEFQLMTQVIKAVETKLLETGEAQLSTVRLKVNALSHLLTHDHATLQTAFAVASRGTKAEGATLEIIPVPANAWCPSCNQSTLVTGSNTACSVCGGVLMARPTEPEVVLHELVVAE